MSFLNVINIIFLEWVEAEDTFALSTVNNLQEAVNTVVKFLGLGVANATENVSETAKTHTLFCSGKDSLELNLR